MTVGDGYVIICTCASYVVEELSTMLGLLALDIVGGITCVLCHNMVRITWQSFASEIEIRIDKRLIELIKIKWLQEQIIQ